MRTRKRKGAIVVLVAVLMVVLLGFGALAVDVSQMQAYKSELRRSADAAVLAATLQLLHETQHVTARTQADLLLSQNPVFGDTATITPFEYGTYDDVVGFTFLCDSGCSVAANAIRLTVRGPDRGFYFAQFIGGTGFALSAQATAWLPVAATPCAAPWAIQESDWLMPLPSSGLPTESSLRNYPQVFTVKRLDLGGFPDSTYGAVNLPPYPAKSGDGIDNYALNVALQNGCHRLVAGDQLQAKLTGYNTETVSGTSAGGGADKLCAPLFRNECYGVGGQIGRAVRIPIVRPVASGSVCTTDVPFPEDRLSTGGALCYEVVEVGTFVVVAVTQGVGEAGQVSAIYAGRNTIGPVRGYAQRPILVQ